MAKEGEPVLMETDEPYFPGTISAPNIQLYGETGAYIGLPVQSAAPTFAGTAIYADNRKRFTILQDDGNSRSLSFPEKSDRVYSFPDADGTVLLTDDSSAITNKSISSSSLSGVTILGASISSSSISGGTASSLALTGGSLSTASIVTPTISGTMKFSTATPTGVTSTGAGSGASVTIVGNSYVGTISVTTGSSPASSAVVVTVTMPISFSSSTFPVILTARNQNVLTDFAKFYASSATTSTWTITNGNTSGLTSGRVYLFNYLVLGS